MTTIVWDGKVLAADRQRTEYGTPTITRKVYRIAAKGGRRFLVGYSGNTDDCVAMMRWMRGRADRPAPKSLHAMSIDEKRRIWVCGESLVWYDIRGFKFWAIGSGADYAMGAMMMGADARRAVRIAAKLDQSTGGGVDVVAFR